MRPTRLALLATLLLTSVAGAAVTTRSDPGFIYGGHNSPFTTGGVSCPGTSVPSLPFSQAGNNCTSGATNTISNYGGPCAVSLPFPYPGPEDIFQIVLGAGNSVGFSLALGGSTGDLAIFLIGTCGDGTSCVANSQDAIGPGVGPELIAAATYPAGDYYLYIDSYYAVGQGGNCGTYTLDITGTLPVELLEFQVN